MTGDVLYSKFDNVMLTIVHDTFRGKHDLQYGFCSFTRVASNGGEGRPSYEVFWERSKREPFFASMMQTAGIGKKEDLPDHGCWENLIDALKGYDIAPEDIPSPFNLLESIEIGPNGEMLWNDYLADCVRRFPDRLLALAEVREWEIDQDPEAAVAEVQRAYGLGLHGLQFVMNGRYRYGVTQPWDEGACQAFWDGVVGFGRPHLLHAQRLAPAGDR